MSFNPKEEYLVVPDSMKIKSFHDFRALTLTRPAYQRKSVWSIAKQQKLMDSLIRRYYIPNLVIREVRLSDTEVVKEVLDGQQRITAVQNFFDNKFALPESLLPLDSRLRGKYEELHMEIQRFICEELKFDAHVIKNINNPRDKHHLDTAINIFRRLQEGESLNNMEVQHAALLSSARNFIVKRADDEYFDFDVYKRIEENRHKHKFFSLLSVSNDRMHHLQYMARFILIERSDDGYADLSKDEIVKLINDNVGNEIGNLDFEKNPEAKSADATMSELYRIFKNHPMHKNGAPLEIFRVEYFIISIYLLIRHLKKFYVLDDAQRDSICEFVFEFFNRWKDPKENDYEAVWFSIWHQQAQKTIADRDRLLRQAFFDYMEKSGNVLILKDSQRAFNERERIAIYHRDKGRCHECLKTKTSEESHVDWADYHADHIIPYIKGGKTEIENARVLCSWHNLSRGAG